jgi:hypothetical protein
VAIGAFTRQGYKQRAGDDLARIDRGLGNGKVSGRWVFSG